MIDLLSGSLEDIDPQVEHVGVRGTFTVDDQCFPLASVKARRAKYRPDQAWEVEFTLDVARTDATSAIFHGITPGGVVRVAQLFGGELELRHITAVASRGGHFTARAWELRRNFGDLPSRPVDQFVVVGFVNGLTPPLGTAGRPWVDPKTGEVETWPVSTTCGEAAYRRGESRDAVRGPAGKGDAVFWPPELHLTVPPRRRRKTVSAFEGLLQDDLDAVSTVLSFMGRRHVGWTSISVFSNLDGRSYHESELQRSAPAPVATAQPYPLLDPRPDSGDAFRFLVDRYRRHQLADTIKAGVVYTTAFYNSPHVEAGLVYAFTALESLVNGWSRHQGTEEILTPPRSHALLKQVKDSVREWALREGIPSAKRALIYEKLPELRRAAVVPRAVAMIGDLQVEWKDLWHDGVELRRGLSDAYQRRSQFIHRGVLAESPAAEKDSHRVAALAERLILALLGGKVAWVSPTAFRLSKWLKEA